MVIPVHVDVVLKDSSAEVKAVEKLTSEMLVNTILQYEPGEIIFDKGEYPQLDALVESVKVVDLYLDTQFYNGYVPYLLADPVYHVYSLKSAVQGEGEEEYIQSGAGDGEYTSAALSYPLPSVVFDGVWESIITVSSIKQQLLGAAETSISMALCGVDDTKVSFNRLMLLYGPPGCGKSSLAMSLAQRLAIRLSSTFSTARLLVINSHSLFSRYYSESGKLVSSMFKSVRDTALDNPTEFVVILIDEVESLSASRDKAIGSGDPSDSIRVVNALLTQIDSLKHIKNIMILATSNLLDSVDSAFLDRVDIKMEVPLPSQIARYNILKESVCELMLKGVISMDDYYTPEDKSNVIKYLSRSSIHEGGSGEYMISFPGPKEDITVAKADEVKNSMKPYEVACVELAKLAAKSVGFSGRTMRKLGFVALAKVWELSKQNAGLDHPSIRVVLDFLPSLDESIGEELRNREHIK